MEHHLALLGHMVEDKVTGFMGICESISFDLYGCVQAVVRPRVTDTNQKPDGQWFDTSRLISRNTVPVMPVPSFAKATVPGPAQKPFK